MRLFFLNLILLLGYNSFSQDTSKVKSTLDTTRETSGRFRIVYTLDLGDSTPSDRIFEYCKMGLYKIYKSGNYVIQNEDKEGGEIYGRASTLPLIYKNTGMKMDGGTFKYTLHIFTKTGKLRIIFADITHHRGQMAQMRDGSDYGDDFPSTWGRLGKSQSEKQWPLMKEQAFAEFLLIINGIKTEVCNKQRETDF